MRSVNLDENSRLIALPLYGIGDVLLTTPALRNIKEKTGAGITYLHMFRATRDILENNPHVDENIHFPFLDRSRLEGLRFLRGLRGRFDASINFYPTNRRDYSLAAFIVGCPLRVGHRYKLHDLRGLNFLKNSTVMEDDSLHCVQENLRLLPLLGIRDPEPYPLGIYLTDEERAFAGAWFEKAGVTSDTLIGMHPGTSLFKGHARRRWPPERFAALINAILGSMPEARVMLFGGPEERPIREEVIKLARAAEPGGRILTEEGLTLRQSAALMERTNAFVTNDSGLMHIAAALKVPTVAVLGPTNPAWVSPWAVNNRVVRHEHECSPCFRYSPVPLKCYSGADFACLSDIGEDEVMAALEELI